MNEYEAATLAFRTASLAAQHAGLWIAGAHVAVGLAVGIAQVAVVWYGIRAMQRAADRRADESRRLEAADERRHAETMQALDTQRQALDRQHAESMQALDVQRQALSTLIARTAPPAERSPT